jgi:hypothetical protein
VHGIELEGMFEKRVEKVPSKMNISEIQIPPSTEKISESFKDKITSAIDSVRKEHKYNEYKDYLEETKNKAKSVADFVKYIETDKKINKRTTLYKNLIKLMDADPSKQQIEEIKLFPDEKPKPNTDFYKDQNVLFFLENIVPKDKLKSVKKEIDWIQEVHKNDGYKVKSGEWKKLTNHTNEEVIRHFENNTKKNKKIESNLLIQIISKLKELYLQNE